MIEQSYKIKPMVKNCADFNSDKSKHFKGDDNPTSIAWWPNRD